MSNWDSLQDIKKFLKTASMQEINEHFTEMAAECRGSWGCGEDSQKVISFLHESGAQCVEKVRDRYLPSIVYQLSANFNERLEMERLCTNLDLTNPVHEKPVYLQPKEFKEDPVDINVLMKALAKTMIEPASDNSVGTHNLDEKIIEVSIDNVIGDGSGKFVLSALECAVSLAANIHNNFEYLYNSTFGVVDEYPY